MIKKYLEFLNENTVGKTIWKVDKDEHLGSIATNKYNPYLVEEFMNMMVIKHNFFETALSFLEKVEVSVTESSYRPSRCFLSSLELARDDDKTESVVGILKRKGSKYMYVHAFNKRNNKYFDNSLNPEELIHYEHYPVKTIEAKNEFELAEFAWLVANSLQVAAEEKMKR